MIDAIDSRLRDWVSSIVDGTATTFLAPCRDRKTAGVCLYLMELREKRSPSTLARPPLQIVLRYLVTAEAEDPLEAHRVLGDLAFAAMEHPDFQVALEPPGAATWAAFGVPPRPAFLLDVPLVKERKQPVARLVEEPVVTVAPLSTLEGVVVGPRRTPIASARVEIPTLRRSTTTDYKGQFHFSALPGDRSVELIVHAKGKTLAVTAGAGRGAGPDRFVIEFPVSEG